MRRITLEVKPKHLRHWRSFGICRECVLSHAMSDAIGQPIAAASDSFFRSLYAGFARFSKPLQRYSDQLALAWHRKDKSLLPGPAKFAVLIPDDF